MEYEDLSEELKLGLFELCKDMIYGYWDIPAISSITLDEELPMESLGAVIDLLKNYNMSSRWDNYMVSKFGLDDGAPIERIKINRNEIFS